MNILLGDFIDNMGRGYFKLTIWNENLHLDNNDNDVTVVNSATSKILVV